ncbi:hypothetical protein H4CHR_04720 [Variovorax sp. PBS-H4]|uniref:hypothetical protein n=1 Tax=Variovorax sp. PBS-H4 TaxID=434008 RepID=UPI001318D909|nr:hypothetical protein [Variovorax sp. PBS-H4]VTU39535.1 hypothetical protein H4CHR_04720 [Variovorax sp. PBS-H4]
MNRADAPLRSVDPIDDPAEEESEDDELSADEALDDETELSDEISETGIDLSDASELDADNVPADEEFDRVMQAPD